MIYIILVIVFCKIGLFSIGGGYAMLTLIQMETVQKYQWLTNKQFADILAISQMTPGPIAINVATFISAGGFCRCGLFHLRSDSALFTANVFNHGLLSQAAQESLV